VLRKALNQKRAADAPHSFLRVHSEQEASAALTRSRLRRRHTPIKPLAQPPSLGRDLRTAAARRARSATLKPLKWYYKPPRLRASERTHPPHRFSGAQSPSTRDVCRTLGKATGVPAARAHWTLTVGPTFFSVHSAITTTHFLFWRANVEQRADDKPS
jgi:hypothetical protein